MDLWEKLAYYCPRPIKRRQRSLTRLAVSLHLPIPRIRQLVKQLTPLLPTSFALSIVPFYSAVAILSWLATRSLLDIGEALHAVLSPFAFLLSIPAFGLFWAGINGLLREMSRRKSKALLFLFCLVIILPAGLTAGLNFGAFDSVTLLSGSVIDLSSGTAWLQIKNDGTTDFQVSTIEVGVLVCHLPSVSAGLKPGEAMAIGIYYAPGGFTAFAPRPSAPQNILTDSFLATPFTLNVNVTPATFTQGFYPVVIHTQRLIDHTFDIEAKALEPEQIDGIQSLVYNLNKETINNENYTLFDVAFTLEMKPLSITCVYSVDIGNLTVTFTHPIVLRSATNNFDATLTLSLRYNTIGVTCPKPSWLPAVDAVPNQPLNTTMFTYGQTYPVTIRTLTNRNYTTSITLSPLR